jgi:hypothetical protein
MSQYYESVDDYDQYNEFYLNGDSMSHGLRVKVENQPEADSTIYSYSKDYKEYSDFQNYENSENSRNYYPEVRHQQNMPRNRIKKKKYDMDIVKRLMDYIEVSMKKRLDAIENLKIKNEKSLKSVKSSYLLVEKKALELKAEKQNGQSLLTDDIKFFFNLVKGGHTPGKHSSFVDQSYDKENFPANGTI